LAARVTGGDGYLSGAGMTNRGGFLVPRGQGEDAQASTLTQTGPVDSVAKECFAIRRISWERLGGWDESFGQMASALAEFCLRARAAGEDITYAPAFAADQAGPVDSGTEISIAVERADTLRLRDMGEGVSSAVT
jgi:GT2 family glycosyltransferase